MFSPCSVCPMCFQCSVYSLCSVVVMMYFLFGVLRLESVTRVWAVSDKEG